MNNCDGSKNEMLVIAATNYARKLMYIDESLWVFINDGKHFKSINHSGLYDKNFIIRFNREWLKTAKEEQILKCAFHEVFHAVQHQEIMKKELGIESKFFPEDELKQLEFEFKDENYNDSSETWGTYLCELQAEDFAGQMYDKYWEEFNNPQELIEKYYEMFKNKE